MAIIPRKWWNNRYRIKYKRSTKVDLFFLPLLGIAECFSRFVEDVSMMRLMEGRWAAGGIKISIPVLVSSPLGAHRCRMITSMSVAKRTRSQSESCFISVEVNNESRGITTERQGTASSESALMVAPRASVTS